MNPQHHLKELRGINKLVREGSINHQWTSERLLGWQEAIQAFNERIELMEKRLDFAFGFEQLEKEILKHHEISESGTPAIVSHMRYEYKKFKDEISKWETIVGDSPLTTPQTKTGQL